MKCLVVEDSATMRRVLANALRGAGCEVVEASDAKHALERCGRDIHAVITAWSLPGMSGVELVRALRANPETAGARVLMVTARNLKHDVLEAIAAGVDSYLLKPFAAEALHGKLVELLRSGPEERAAA